MTTPNPWLRSLCPEVPQVTRVGDSKVVPLGLFQHSQSMSTPHVETPVEAAEETEAGHLCTSTKAPSPPGTSAPSLDHVDLRSACQCPHVHDPLLQTTLHTRSHDPEIMTSHKRSVMKYICTRGNAFLGQSHVYPFCILDDSRPLIQSTNT